MSLLSAVIIRLCDVYFEVACCCLCFEHKRSMCLPSTARINEFDSVAKRKTLISPGLKIQGRSQSAHGLIKLPTHSSELHLAAVILAWCQGPALHVTMVSVPWHTRTHTQTSHTPRFPSSILHWQRWIEVLSKEAPSPPLLVQMPLLYFTLLHTDHSFCAFTPDSIKLN